MAIIIVNDASFQTEVVESKLPVLVDFFAEWCGPCKMLSPVVEKLSQEFDGRVKFVKVNTDDSPRTSRSFEVQGIPTLLVFKEGQPTARQVGYIQESQLRNFIEGQM